MRRYIISYVLFFIAASLYAQSLSVNAPKRVDQGEQFRLQYTINTDNATNFRIGEIPEELEVLFGPSRSAQSSYQVVNGHASSSSSITFTYLLYANKKGTYTIPAAHIKVGGKNISSNAIKITVTASSNKHTSRSARMHDDVDEESQMRRAGTNISSKDLFIRVSANKKRVHEQEPILLTYKVYTLVDLTQLEGKMPDLTGFHTQEVKLPQQKSFHIERVNGRNYRCVTWSQYVMYPQMTGKLQIPSITFKGMVVLQNRNVDPFEAFFNGGSGYVEVKKNIIAPSISIQVDPLPKRPVGFSGGVGHFNITAQLNKKEVKAGEPISIRVIVGGIGNLKLIKQPEIKFPKDFDKYDAKLMDKTKSTTNGVEGNMIYDFLAVPRNQGRYKIPAVEFTYYDTNENSYKTIKTNSFIINVTKGAGKGSISDYGDMKDSDIRPIKTGESDKYNMNDFFFGSVLYWSILISLFVVFVILLIVFRKKAMDRTNIGKMRGKKANKIAVKRLHKANKLMLAGKRKEFYDEVLRALWGYMGDKMNIPVEQLSRENIKEKLLAYEVDEETINKFVNMLDECEYERYSPGDIEGNMNKIFESARMTIMRIEGVVKSSKRQTLSGAKTLLFIFSLIILPIYSNAITKVNADAEYNKENYHQAIKDYEELLKSGASSDLYYNLANSYYRTDNITMAVLNYERALMLSPGDKDIRFNLQMANSKTIDKITPESEMFFVTLYKELVNYTSVDNWAYISIFSFLSAILLVLMYIFANSIVLRKIGFFGSLIVFCIFVFSNIFAFQQKYQLEHRTGAIIIASSASVKATPVINGKEQFVIHEGTKVDITDRTVKGWKGIRIADGREGWIQTKNIEEI